MLNPESMLHLILGSVRSDIRSLAYAIEIAENLLFSQHLDMDDIKVTEHIYSRVADRLEKQTATVAKAIERLTPLCWDALVLNNLLPTYIGDTSMQMPPPRTLIIYFAVYVHFKMPFSLAVELYPNILFPSTSSTYFPTSLSNVDVMRRTQPLSVINSEHSVPICPNCANKLIRTFQHYCDNCSQCLDWSHYKTSKSLTSLE